MRVFKIILTALFSLLAACLLAFTVFILLDPVVGMKQPPVTLDTNQIFVAQEPEAVPAVEAPEEEELPPEEEEPAVEPEEDLPEPEVVQAPEDEAVTAARAYAQTMSVEEKIWQLFFVTPENLTGVNRATRAGETTQKAIEAKPVGGIVYFAANLEDREQAITMLSNTRSYSKLPLFLALDEEGGLVSRAGDNEALGVTRHSAAAEYGQRADMKEVYEVGKTMALELRELGFNVNFAPVADVLTVENNTEISTRSYSSDPEVAAAMVSAMVQGLQQNGMASCLKHFPGHGSVRTDSHEGKAVSDRTPQQLQESDWVPFRAGIQQEAAFVMLSHLTNEHFSQLPASLSAEVVTALRQELGFEGVIITDSLQMRAVTDYYSSDQAAVMALQAGADMLLIPNDLQKAYDGVLKAVQDKALTEERITESVVRILAAKYRLGLMEQEATQ